MTKGVFCLGNALFDFSAPCEASLLEKYDLKPDENIEATSKHDDLFSYLLQNKTAFQSAGGSAQNTAKVIQWVLSDLNERQATFVGCIGNDEYGKKLQEHMEKCKVDVIYNIHKTAPTGITAALITDDSKRSLCARLGAASLFCSDFIDSPLIQSKLQISKIIYVEGYFLSHNSQCVLKLAEFAQRMGKMFTINLSAVYICENEFDVLKSCILLSDVVFGNKEEAIVFANKCGLSFSSVEHCALAISSMPCNKNQKMITVITQGPDPLIVAIEGNVSTYNVPIVEPIGDTIGCGDAFVGGFLSALLLDKTQEIAAQWGIYCATEIARTRGCTIPLSSADLI